MSSAALRAVDTLVQVDTALPSGHVPEKGSGEPEATKLYLAYGSNLAAKTFEGRRNIKPLRAINVQAPDLQLVFDLPGVPYLEPCFANTRVRARPDDTPGPPPAAELARELSARSPLLPDASAAALGWDKGLVGVVYEVTAEDYARIIATEGGGSSYADVLVDCFELDGAAEGVPATPRGAPFKAHTLLADPAGRRGGTARPDGAQPSARYLGLLTSGAAEHDLPAEYRDWLAGLQPYVARSLRQKVGRVVFPATWIPAVALVFAIQSLTTGKDGRSPAWVARLAEGIFAVMWKSYDLVYKKIFGDGERAAAKGAAV